MTLGTATIAEVSAANRRFYMSQPATLVGHAYSGTVIGATRSESVEALVYVNSLVPDAGETVLDVFMRTAPHPLAPQVAPDENGLTWLPEEAFAQAFAPQAIKRGADVPRAMGMT
jgi:hypothetical protein